MQVQTARAQMSPLKIGIILTALTTASIHLYLAMGMYAEGTNAIMFVLNGLGYLGLLLAYFLPASFYRRFLPASLANGIHRLARIALLLYTLLTLGMWAAVGMRTTIAYVDKLAEVLLVVFLLLDRPQAG